MATANIKIDTGTRNGEWEANAHLIAAAPDLLEALKELMKSEMCTCTSVDTPLYKALFNAKRVIERAEGRTA